MKRLLFITAAVFLLYGCRGSGCDSFEHAEKNSIYYWKTVLSMEDEDFEFIRNQEIGRIYLRMFDVGIGEDGGRDTTVPLGTLKVPENVYYKLNTGFENVSIVPVVYITLEGLKKSKGNEGQLAQNIVERVKNMCSYNNISNVEGLQLDCDWTVTTEQSFFSLCDSVKARIEAYRLPWSLSSTIRLHQLGKAIPPVDYGVLMVYNTGDFKDPDERNSIISKENVAPYLKHLSRYPLHLDVAYPTYSWQLLFSNRKFIGLLNGVNLADTACFAEITPNKYVAVKDVPYNGKIIRKGDVVKQENSDYNEIIAIKEDIEKAMNRRRHSNILYHFDLNNLSKYNDYEIKNIFYVSDN